MHGVTLFAMATSTTSSRSSEIRKSRSTVWAHFVKVGDGATCNHCGYKIYAYFTIRCIPSSAFPEIRTTLVCAVGIFFGGEKEKKGGVEGGGEGEGEKGMGKGDSYKL